MGLVNIYHRDQDFYNLDLDCEGGNEKALMIRHMRNYLARRNSTIIWGNGFVFESEDENLEKFFNNYAKKQRLLPMFIWVEEQISKYGRAIITLNKTLDGEIRPMVADSRFLNMVGKSFYNEDIAVVYQRLIQDNSH